MDLEQQDAPAVSNSTLGGNTGHAGGCLCGQIRFLASSDPRRINVCHCRFCQRNTGTAYLVEPVFPADAFEVVVGKPKAFELPSAGSGKRVTIHFCETCGTRVYMTFERFPGIVGAFAGAFDDPNQFALTSDVVRHLFTASAQHGVLLPADVPLFDGHAIMLDGSPAIPAVLPSPKLVVGEPL